MEKSYVTVEQRVCPICGKMFDSGNLLLDTRLRNTFNHYTVTGYNFCPECEPLTKERIALIVANSDDKSSHHMKLEEANRTGEILWMNRDAAKEIFTHMGPNDLDRPFIFIDPEAAEKLKHLVGNRE